MQQELRKICPMFAVAGQQAHIWWTEQYRFIENHDFNKINIINTCFSYYTCINVS